jgi:hypothetical protein
MLAGKPFTNIARVQKRVRGLSKECPSNQPTPFEENPRKLNPGRDMFNDTFSRIQVPITSKELGTRGSGVPGR